MKLQSFRIKNYKSIIDSGECRLSDNDNITVLAGQNESGKSSILQALRDYENSKLDLDCLRDDDTHPEITCVYTISKEGLNDEDIFEDDIFPESFKEIIKKITELTIIKTFNSQNECKVTTVEKLTSELADLIKVENGIRTSNNEGIRIKNNLAKTLADTESSLHEEEDDTLETEVKLIAETELLNTEIFIEEFIKILFNYTPKIIFFDDFCDILPDSILLADLISSKKDTPGLQAVKNIQTILKADFSKLNDVQDNRRETEQTSYQESITTKFNDKWKQKISDGDGAKIHVKYYQGTSKGASYLKFYIETKKGEYLPASKRSQGFKWFLSFFLHLKAEEERSNELIILFDEPGLYLHSKAQADMISVFEELGLINQIIYSTHSPYLIDTTKLHRLKLILNTKKHGTTIEKITSIKIGNQKDALKPIIDALGLEIASPFSVAKKNNIILEGISDFHYMQAMKLLLNKKYEIGLIPSMGSSNCHLLMELCIGWQLNWLIIFDDKGASNDYNKIKKNFFNDIEEDTNKKIYKIKGCDGIEDIFTIGDMKLVNGEASFSIEKKNSSTVSQYGGKELYSRLFYEKVMTGQITKENISKTALKKFEDIFLFIENGFKINE